MKVFGFAGWSGSGKTTLIEQLIPRLVARAGTVSLVKHAHHAFDIDHPGKDSYRHREAGCTEVLVSSARRYAMTHELRGGPELTLREALERLSPCDVVLVEGLQARAASPSSKCGVRRSASRSCIRVDAAILGHRDRHARGPGRRRRCPSSGWTTSTKSQLSSCRRAADQSVSD